jgi:MGT family glycosyltransferase
VAEVVARGVKFPDRGRFLFVVPPLMGHVNPTLSVGSELLSRGHQVAWAAHPQPAAPLLPPGATLLPLDGDAVAPLFDKSTSRSRPLRGAVAFKFGWEEFLLPLARIMLPEVEAALDSFQPQALAVDQQTVAGALVARRRGLPWATLATTSASVSDSLAGLPLVLRWQADRLAALEQEIGLPPAESPDISPRLVIVFSTEALAGPSDRFPSQVRFVGPSISHRRDTVPFPWEALRECPRVLVSLGTVNMLGGGRFFATVVEALGDQPFQVILVAPPELVGSVPANVLVRPFVPQLALLPHVSAVVCHGGHNTVCEALANALPLVVAPIRDDQTIVAQQVVEAGAGVRVRFGRVGAKDLRDAVLQVMSEPRFREAAGRVQQSFVAAGGSKAAADLLQGLL